NGLTKPSYLFGTVHLIDKKDFHVRPFIDSVFDSAEQVVFEIKLDDTAAFTHIQQKMFLPAGITLAGLMEPETYGALKTYFADSLHMDISLFNTMKPFVLIQAVTERSVRGEAQSYELYFLEKCMALNKPLLGLETIDEQLSVFDSIPFAEQIKWLVQWTNSSAQYDSTFQDLIQAYKKEDMNAIAKYMQESAPEFMQYEDLFVYDRNKRWIPQIEELIKTKSTFIAVGAGHLPGEEGLIELLRKKKYTVKPV
ncbi:MAG: TraB/GumN family protein, partial [Chitinophagales bacterium]|nr:TraB/GumN family protein [Chitinophagales bacterium]